jgi:hypothetical protein
MEDFPNDFIYSIEPPLELIVMVFHKFLMHQQAQHQHMDVAQQWDF